MAPLTDTEIKAAIRNKRNRGGKRGRPKTFSDDQAHMLRRCYSVLITDRSQLDIAELFGVSVPTLMKMVRKDVD